MARMWIVPCFFDFSKQDFHKLDILFCRSIRFMVVRDAKIMMNFYLFHSCFNSLTAKHGPIKTGLSGHPCSEKVACVWFVACLNVIMSSLQITGK